MTDLYIFTKNHNDYQTDRIVEELQKMGLSYQRIVYRYLGFKLNKKLELFYQGKPLKPPKMAIFRSAGHGEVGSHYVPYRQMLISEWDGKVTILNQKTYEQYIRLDKLQQHYVLFKNKIPVIDTTYFTSNHGLDETRFSYPVIVKNKYGSCGRNVFKAEGKKELQNLLDTQATVNCLLQPFLTTGCDYRVIVVGGQAIGAMKKTAQEGEFLTNFSCGGKVEGVELDGELTTWAQGASKAFECEYSGIDIMYDKRGQGYVLEVNRACQFKGFESCTGINVAKKTLEFLVEKHNK